MAARQTFYIKTRRSPEGFEYTQVEGWDVTIQYGVHDTGIWRKHRHDDDQILILPSYGCEAELLWWAAKLPADAGAAYLHDRKTH